MTTNDHPPADRKADSFAIASLAATGRGEAKKDSAFDFPSLRPLSPADLAPPPPLGTTAEQRIAMWRDLMNACEQFLLAGLRRKIGPQGDLQVAYRQWYAREMEQHDRETFEWMQRLARREESDAS